MASGTVDIQSKFVQALRTQKATERPGKGALPCPYGHQGRIFLNIEQLYDHVKAEHGQLFDALEPDQVREQLKTDVDRLR